MRFKGWICSLVLSFVGFAANAQLESTLPTTPEGCISQADMADIARSFRQFSNLAGRDYCYDGSQTAQLLAGIMFMRRTAFEAQMPKSSDELFSGAFATSWWNYFIGRINEFSVESSCQKGVVAFVYMWGNTMYVCPAALTTSFSSLDLASVFMHEARHIDGFPHTTCRSGPRAGLQGACDTRIAAGGSYAVTVETYAQLGRYATDIHPALRTYAQKSAVIYADEAFDQAVRIDRETMFMLLTNDKQFHEMTGAGAVKSLGHAPAVGHLAPRAQYMILYPDDKNLASGFVFPNGEGDLGQTAGDISVEYNQSSPAARAEWIDIHIGAQWHAKVKRSEIIFGCDPRSASTRSVSTGGEVPRSLLYPTGYDRAARSTQLMMESGRVFEVGCSSGNPVFRDTGTRYDQAFKRIHKAGNDVVGLTVDGRLFRVNGTTSTPLNTSLDGRIHDLVSYQGFNFFK